MAEETEGQDVEGVKGLKLPEWRKLAGWQKAGVLVGAGGILVGVFLWMKNNQQGSQASTVGSYPSLTNPTYAATNYPGEGDIWPPITTTTPTPTTSSTPTGTTTQPTPVVTSGAGQIKQPVTTTTAKTITVTPWGSQYGSLWNIAQSVYGNGSLWPQIYAANKGTIGPNPNLIHPGQVLTIPQ